jgi:hypothetical protein
VRNSGDPRLYIDTVLLMAKDFKVQHSSDEFGAIPSGDRMPAPLSRPLCPKLCDGDVREICEGEESVDRVKMPMKRLADIMPLPRRRTAVAP